MNQERAGDEVAFEALLDYIRRSRGFDFGGYKRTSLTRRVDKRMKSVDVPDYASYVEYLEVHPEEFGHLFDTILINVTAFFRDQAAWDVLAAEIVPRLLAGKGPDEPIRLWSAGCASGEEAFTLAIVMAEAMGIDQVRERVKIYATDVDEDALSRARHSCYTAREVEGVPPALLDRYFESVGSRFLFHKDLRRVVIFGRNDLIQDAPISRIDLLACRNTLMYFNGETQARILDRFHFALNPRACLFLGKAETLLTHHNTFAAKDLKRRIFAKVPRGHSRERFITPPRPLGDQPAPLPADGPSRLPECAFEMDLVPQLLVDAAGTLALANGRARSLFRLGPGDLGVPLQDLQVSYRPVDLRSCIDRAYAERKPVLLSDVEWPMSSGESAYLDVHVVPLIEPGGGVLGVHIRFLDVTANRLLRDELQGSKRELETAYEELQSTVEELETTNEELQSTVEELETTNEELYSTNEELETMNEELQSTNDELESVNEERRERGEELTFQNQFLESILKSLRLGIVVVGDDLAIRLWNPRAEDLWGLRLDEVRDKNLLDLDIGLPVEDLGSALRSVLSGRVPQREVALEAMNRRGKAILCRVTCMPLAGKGDHVTGAIVLMEDVDPAAPDGAPAAPPPPAS